MGNTLEGLHERRAEITKARDAYIALSEKRADDWVNLSITLMSCALLIVDYIEFFNSQGECSHSA